MRQQDPFGEEKTRLPAVELKSSLPSTASVRQECVCVFVSAVIVLWAGCVVVAFVVNITAPCSCIFKKWYSEPCDKTSL